MLDVGHEYVCSQCKLQHSIAVCTLAFNKQHPYLLRHILMKKFTSSVIALTTVTCPGT